MRTDYGELPCAGYDANQIDFPQLYATLSPGAQQVLEQMLEAAVSVESGAVQGHFSA
jgi:hypothetical protein